MTLKRPGILLFALISCATSFAQASFQGLTAGTSTQEEVVKVLGTPTRQLTKTLYEFPPPSGLAKVEVEFGSVGSTLIVKRIEVYLISPVTRTALVKKFGLPSQADAKTTNTQGCLVEYFGGASQVALTYRSKDATDGVLRITYMGPRLFDNTVAGLRGGLPSSGGQSKGAASVANPGRTTGPATASGTAGNMPRNNGASSTNNKANNNVPIKPLNPPRPGSEVVMSERALSRFVGIYSFGSGADNTLKEARAEIVSGKLKWITGEGSYILKPVTADEAQFTARGLEMTQFKLEGKTGTTVSFFMQGDTVQQVMYMEELQRGRPVILMGTPKRRQ